MQNGGYTITLGAVLPILLLTLETKKCRGYAGLILIVPDDLGLVYRAQIRLSKRQGMSDLAIDMDEAC